MEPILEIKNITKEFPGVKALDDVSFSIMPGEVHAIVGENGAGKSTLMNILSGVFQPTSGEVKLEGNVVNFQEPKDAQNHGISIIHQEFSLIPQLNGIDNIFLGREIKQKNGLLNRRKMRSIAKDILARLDAQINLSNPVSQLSVANQQFIEIAKAISVETKVLIFDEPTTSLTSKEVDKLFKLINTLKESGVTILYISHHLDEIMTLCDRYTCLRDGEYVGTRVVLESTKQEMIKMMVGREIVNTYPDKPHHRSDEVILEVSNMSNDIIKDVSFNLKKGEILGVAGLVGSGRTETVRALIGADDTDSKEIIIDGKKSSINNPTDALRNGICLVPENRQSQGLVLSMSVRKNITLSIINDLTNKIGIINEKEELRRVKDSIEDLLIKTPSSSQMVKNLSGGNQQKVVLAKWLNTDCNILIFDEPTRGIDVGAKEEIYRLMRDLAAEGISIIMISSELPEVIGMSDRVLVMHEGTIQAELINDEIESEKIMQHAVGGVQNE